MRYDSHLYITQSFVPFFVLFLSSGAWRAHRIISSDSALVTHAGEDTWVPWGQRIFGNFFFFLFHHFIILSTCVSNSILIDSFGGACKNAIGKFVRIENVKKKDNVHACVLVSMVLGLGAFGMMISVQWRREALQRNNPVDSRPQAIMANWRRNYSDN